MRLLWREGGKAKSLQFKLNVTKVKVSTHVCLLCLERVMAIEDRHNESWPAVLCKVSNTANGSNNLFTKHKHHKTVVALKEKQMMEENPQGALVALPTTELTGPNITINKNFSRQRRAESIKIQAKWLGLNGIPHNYTQVPEYAEMFRIYDPKFAAISRKIYLKELELLFNQMIEGIVHLCDIVRSCTELRNVKYIGKKSK